MFSALARCQGHLAGSAARQCMLQRLSVPLPIHKIQRTHRCYAAAPPGGTPAYNSGPQYSQYQDSSNYPPSADYQSQGYAAQDRSDRRYISWTVYKSKSAMSVSLVRPRYMQNPDGSFKIEREGGLSLEFATALQGGPQESSNANRKYDWQNKQKFHLSATELALIVDEPLATHQFYHDPKKGTPEENTIGKNLKWNPPANDKDPKATWYMNLTVSNKAASGSLNYSIGLTKGELAVLKNLAPNLIWHMLGFSEVTIPAN